MAGVREGARIARSLGKRQWMPRTLPTCAGRFASTAAESKSSSTSDELSDVDSASSFGTPSPDEQVVETFKNFREENKRDKGLPGNRYQFHPPKYDRGPLHPVQSPQPTDPTARDFKPGPFNVPRLKHTYEGTIATDLMTLTYTHRPPGFVPPVSQKGVLRQWDGSSPYHKNRPARPPRGGPSKMGLVERDITWNNIPKLKAVSVSAYSPSSSEDKEFLHVAMAVVQAITGEFSQVATIKRDVQSWGIRKGRVAGAKATLYGPSAYEFVDKLVTLVLPKIKDWPGLKATTGDGSGNLALGMDPKWMAYFPELEYNYDMYPIRLMPGCNIYIHTTGTSDRQGRLLLEALGFPFYGKVRQ